MKLYYFLTNKGYRSFDKTYLSTKPKTHKELAATLASSYAVLDINDVMQNGLTIRTFEALFSGKKIITTNSSIVNYDFYDPKHILVIDRNDVVIPTEFFNDKTSKIEYKCLDRYSAKGWIKDVFRDL